MNILQSNCQPLTLDNYEQERQQVEKDFQLTVCRNFKMLCLPYSLSSIVMIAKVRTFEGVVQGEPRQRWAADDAAVETLHCISLHYTASHCILLHYTAAAKLSTVATHCSAIFSVEHSGGHLAIRYPAQWQRCNLQYCSVATFAKTSSMQLYCMWCMRMAGSNMQHNCMQSPATTACNVLCTIEQWQTCSPHRIRCTL